MKVKIVLLCAVLTAALLNGCGRHGGQGPPPAQTPPNTEVPSSVEDGVPVVHLTGDDNMHYNGNAFTVHAGQPVRVEVHNIGHKPRDQMAHNFVLVKPDTDVVTFNLVCAQAKATGYMTPEEQVHVIASTAFAGPGETVQVQFTAPDPGKYPFLCNFPGHYAAGMKGVMTVVP